MYLHYISLNVARSPFQYVRTIAISSPDHLGPVAVNGSGTLFTTGDSSSIAVWDQDGPIHVFYNPAVEDPVEDGFITMAGGMVVMMGGILSLVAVVRGVELFSRGKQSQRKTGPVPPLAACPLCHHEVPPGTAICPHCGRHF